MCQLLNMYGPEYESDCNYVKVLDIPGFKVCQVSAYESIVQGSEYARIWLNNALRHGSEYAWSTFHRVLNKPLDPIMVFGTRAL